MLKGPPANREEQTLRIDHIDSQSLVLLVTVKNLMWNSGKVQGTQQDQSTHTQDERQDLCCRMELPSPFGLEIAELLS